MIYETKIGIKACIPWPKNLLQLRAAIPEELWTRLLRPNTSTKVWVLPLLMTGPSKMDLEMGFEGVKISGPYYRTPINTPVTKIWDCLVSRDVRHLMGCECDYTPDELSLIAEQYLTHAGDYLISIYHDILAIYMTG